MAVEGRSSVVGRVDANGVRLAADTVIWTMVELRLEGVLQGVVACRGELQVVVWRGALTLVQKMWPSTLRRLTRTTTTAQRHFLLFFFIFYNHGWLSLCIRQKLRAP